MEKNYRYLSLRECLYLDVICVEFFTQHNILSVSYHRWM